MPRRVCSCSSSSTLAYHEAVDKKKMRNEADLEEAIIHGAVKRVRPKMMTVMAAFMGLLPIMWATGAGSDAMKRDRGRDDRGDSQPLLSGIIGCTPSFIFIWKWRFEMKQGKADWIQTVFIT